MDEEQASAFADGSSPRTRGTLFRIFCADGPTRFIPAYAGNTYFLNRMAYGNTVHPRVRGEHEKNKTTSVKYRGSSPRTRGTRADRPVGQVPRRFIPAYAGNTAARQTAACVRPVHPRVRGEHEIAIGAAGESCGSSPRTRGTQEIEWRDSCVFGFIPAYAGNTVVSSIILTRSAVHPRVRGEHDAYRRQLGLANGSSPRTRGTRRYLRPRAQIPRFIPAYAGNTLAAVS